MGGLRGKSILLAAAIGGALLLGLGLLARKAFDATREFQRLNAMLVTATGSQAAATRAIQLLQRFAAATPYSLNQVTEAYIRLRNLGLQATERALRSYGNTASSMGTTMMQFVEAVADAATGEFERLKEYGIRASKDGNKVRFTFRGITTEVQNNAAAIEGYLMRLGEVQFAGSMERQSRTLNGVMSNLGDTVDRMLVKFGSGFATAIYGAVQGLERGVGGLEAFAEKAGQVVGTILNGLIRAFQFLSDHGRLLGGVLTVLGSVIMGRIVIGGVVSMIAAFTRLRAALVITQFASVAMGGAMTANAGRAALAMGSLRLATGGLMAMMGGPWGIAIAAVAAGLYYLATRETEAQVATNRLKEATDQLHAVQADPTSTRQAIQNSTRRAEQTRRETNDVRNHTRALLQNARASLNEHMAAIGRGGGKGSLELHAGQAAMQDSRVQQYTAELAALDSQIAATDREIADARAGRRPPEAAAVIAANAAAASATSTAERNVWRSREEAIGGAGRELQSQGLGVGENSQFGGVHARHTFSGHGRYAIDVNQGQGLVEADNAAARARFDALALSYQARGFRVLWNNRIYEAGGNGPGGSISSANERRRARGQAPIGDHRNHLHMEAPGSIVGRDRGNTTSAAELATQRADELERGQRAYEEMVANMERERGLLEMTVALSGEETKLNELRNAFGEQWLTIGETERAAMEARVRQEYQLLQAAQLVAELRRNNDTAQRELAFQTRIIGMTDRQRAVEEAAYRIEETALERGVSLTNEKLQAEIARARIIAGQNYDLQQQNRLLEAAARYSPAYARSREMTRLATERAEMERLIGPGGPLEAFADEIRQGMALASRAASNTFYSEFADRIEALGDVFGGTFGGIISKIGKLLNNMVQSSQGNFAQAGPLGAFVNLFGRRIDGSLNNLGSAFQRENARMVDSIFNGDAFRRPLSSIGSGIDSLRQSFAGPNGSFMQGLGTMLGRAGMGAQIGQAVGGIGKMFWGKFSSTGSQIGGALGGLTGNPIIAAAASVVGGIIGGLMKKTPKSSATSSVDAFGDIKIGSASGSKKLRDTVDKMVSSYEQSLRNIQQLLGADLLPGLTLGTLGARGKKFTYDPSGSGKTKGSGVLKFDTEQGAIEAALKDAIARGVLTGISDFSQRVLRAAKDLNAAAALAGKYETIIRELALLDDPIMGPLKDLNKEFEKLRGQMIANGATAGELANIDRYYQLKRKEMMDESLSELKDFQEKLRGPGSGITGVNRLNRMLSEFAKFEAEIASGKAIDASAFTALGGSIFDLASSLYGTATPYFQSILSRLNAANSEAMDNVNSAYNENQAVVDAVVDNTQYLVDGNQLLVVNNDLLGSILEAIENGNQTFLLQNNLGPGVSYGGINPVNL